MLLYPYTQTSELCSSVHCCGSISESRWDVFGGIPSVGTSNFCTRPHSMLAGVCRHAAFSRAVFLSPRATLQREALLRLRLHPRPSPPLSLHFSTSPRLRNQHGPEHVTAKEQRRKDWMVVRRLIGNVWPEHDWNTRFRVVLGFALLISGKVPLFLHLVPVGIHHSQRS